MDSIRVSEAPDPGSIPGETTNFREVPVRSASFSFWAVWLSLAFSVVFNTAVIGKCFLIDIVGDIEPR